MRKHVKPLRDAQSASDLSTRTWWLHAEPRPDYARSNRLGFDRFICTPTVAKHRLFVWARRRLYLPDHQLIVFAREDDYFFGVLHSRAHEVWSLRMGTWLGVGNDPRYTPTTCFETFPLPWPPGQEPVADPRVIEIGAAAKELDDTRTAWLNPPRRDLRGRAQEAHPDQPLQPAPDLAAESPTTGSTAPSGPPTAGRTIRRRRRRTRC